MYNFAFITYFKLHFIELKYNFIIFSFSFFFLFLICSFSTDQILYLVIKPLLKITTLKYFIYTEITDIFFLNFYISLIISLVIYLPFLIIQIWFFLIKGLNKKENFKIFKLIILWQK